MQSITLNITNLNNSLQVGDLIYAVQPVAQAGAEDQQGFVLGNPTGQNRLVGVLRNIAFNANSVTLVIDDTVATLFPLGYTGTATIVNPGDFIMFSKYSQTDGDLIGYYAKARFSNSSNVHAELFSVGSEVILNSK